MPGHLRICAMSEATCSRRSPPLPQRPVFSTFLRGGLHFGCRTTSSRDLTATRWGNCTTRGSDTPATRCTTASYSAKPPPLPAWRAPHRLQDRAQCRLARKTRPTSAKTPNLGCCERAGRTFSRPARQLLEIKTVKVITGSSHFGVWGWCSKRPGDCGQCRGTTTEHRSSPREPHQPKLARNSDTRTLRSTPKRCNSNGAISTFEIHVGELRATFLRNHNMRRHKDPSRRHPKPGRQPKRKTTQAQKTPATPTAATTATSTGALHPLRGGAPEQKRCIAYGSGAAPQQTRTNAELAHRTTHRHTPPCAPGPYWRRDGHAAHATTCTPAHSRPLRHLLHP